MKSNHTSINSKIKLVKTESSDGKRYNNNNNTNHDDIYSVVIMTKVIARVHSVHPVNVEQRQGAADPQTKPSDLGCESACLLYDVLCRVIWAISVGRMKLVCLPTIRRHCSATSKRSIILTGSAFDVSISTAGY